MARRLLRWLRARLPASVRDGLTGDLEELHAERTARDGRARADLWLARQVIVSAARYARPSSRDAGAGAGWRLGEPAHMLRSSLRQVARRPGHAVAMVVTMALGLGPAILGFTLVNGVLLSPLPYPGAERIVSVSEDNPEIDISVGWSSLPNYRDFRDQARGFDALAVFRGRSLSIGTDAEPVYAYGARVSSEFFDVFGVQPELGRGFTPAEATVTGDPVVVLSHDLWIAGYGGDPGILGRTVEIDGAPHTVVGVMPAGFAAPSEWIGPGVGMALWRPFPVDMEEGRDNRSYVVVGRLADGMDLASERAEIERVHAGLRAAWPEANERWRPQVFGWTEVIVAPLRTGLWVLMGTMLLVLAIAGANVVGLAANSVLARAREMATRVALGASRASVVVQVLSDVAALTVLGGALGIFAAYGALRGIQALEPGQIPRLASVSLDGSVLLFGLLLMAATVLAVGLLVSLLTLRVDPAVRLRGGARSGDRAGSRLRGALAAAQLVVSFALLSGAALMTRSLLNRYRAPLGFDPGGVTAMTVALSWDRVGIPEERTRFTRDLLAQLRAVPGVEAVAMINSLPLSGSRQVSRMEIEGVTDPGREPALALRGTSAAYHETMGIPVVAGRAFEPTDEETFNVAVVNETAARLHWPGASPVGARIRPAGSADWLTIVGVVGDVLHDGPGGTVLPEVYSLYPLDGLTSKSFVVRSRLDGARMAVILREALHRVDPAQPVREIRSMTDWAGHRLAPFRFTSAIMIAAALLALTLAAVGLFAALASLVGERRRDIAVRVALGSGKGGVARMVGRHAGSLLTPGVVGGLLLALGLGRLLRSFLFGVGAQDIPTLAGVTFALLAVGGLAAALPTARALGVEPAEVLREE
jgi:predicted permease